MKRSVILMIMTVMVLSMSRFVTAVEPAVCYLLSHVIISMMTVMERLMKAQLAVAPDKDAMRDSA
jgi:hypothetical protein